MKLPPHIRKLLGDNAAKMGLSERGTSMAHAVLEFMIAFEQPPIHEDAAITPADFNLAEKLMQEEIRELAVGFDKFKNSKTLENKMEFVDGAIDTIYVILWSLLKFGVPVDACFNEVQRSNMAKLQPDGSCLKNEHGKVKKPDGWTPPNLFEILKDKQVHGMYLGGIRYHGQETSESSQS